MNPIIFKILPIFGFGVVWLFVCIALYKSSRQAAWLASSTVASCLFFLGMTVAVSFIVSRALALAPLWLALLGLLVLHLRAALKTRSGPPPTPSFSTSPTQAFNSGDYI
jgi:hypothetical protein